MSDLKEQSYGPTEEQQTETVAEHEIEEFDMNAALASLQAQVVAQTDLVNTTPPEAEPAATEEPNFDFADALHLLNTEAEDQASHTETQPTTQPEEDSGFSFVKALSALQSLAEQVVSPSEPRVSTLFKQIDVLDADEDDEYLRQKHQVEKELKEQQLSEEREQQRLDDQKKQILFLQEQQEQQRQLHEQLLQQQLQIQEQQQMILQQQQQQLLQEVPSSSSSEVEELEGSIVRAFLNFCSWLWFTNSYINQVSLGQQKKGKLLTTITPTELITTIVVEDKYDYNFKGLCQI